ncbi:MAG: hypothetical protein ACOX7I_00140 [Oscillospiraceae bacterium]|jgi:hypothetical protein
MKRSRSERWKLAIYFILRVLVVLLMIRELVLRQWYNALLCLLTLVLFMVPSIVERRLKIDLPNTMEIIVLLFIFAAEILGELGSFFIRVPHWDTMLHTLNGFLMAALGFALVDIFNRNPRFHFNLSPAFMSFVAFCFSITVGVMWEFFEFFADRLLNWDMQKDSLVNTIVSANIGTMGGSRVIINDISQVIITGTVNGEITDTIITGGYLDIGLYDTMSDMLVNLIGAAVFSAIGYFYIKGRSKGTIASAFIPHVLTEEEIEESEKQEKKKKPFIVLK